MRPSISRRTALSGLAALLLPSAGHGTSGEEISISSEGARLLATRYAAAAAGKRPAVLLLHGARGVELKPRAYQRYGDALSTAGIDAYLLRYMTESDSATLDPATSTQESRVAYETKRYDGWSETVSATISSILGRPDCSGRVGQLGFSQGGFIAANTAARDGRIAALAVLYAGMPEAMAGKVKRMPPTIALHGEADRNVSIASGRKLIELATSVGAEAEFVSYPGKAHGFDFSDADPATSDAIDRVTRFLQRRLAA